jgi:enamine deaminase RidA (YjgF/YER057c/UK114 family)
LLDARHAAFEGAPAACALGPAHGPLAIACLSGALPARPVENPRQVSAYRYPTSYGPRSPSFSRAAVVDAGGGRLLLLSGTASIVGHESLHAGDVRAQTDETLRNLQAVSDAASDATHRYDLCRAQLNVYLRHAADADAVIARLARALGTDSPALRDLLVLQADVCRAELLVEIEGHAEALTGAAA